MYHTSNVNSCLSVDWRAVLSSKIQSPALARPPVCIGQRDLRHSSQCASGSSATASSSGERATRTAAQSRALHFQRRPAYPPRPPTGRGAAGRPCRGSVGPTRVACAAAAACLCVCSTACRCGVRRQTWRDVGGGSAPSPPPPLSASLGWGPTPRRQPLP